MGNSSVSIAFSDIVAAARRYSLAGMLGWQDVRQRYRRSSLGPFWLTISMGVMIGTIGLVFGGIFATPMADFFPFLSIGLILWGFISSVLTEGCTGFIGAENIIKQLPIPLFVHILRMMWRNILILGHNILILPLVFIFVGKPLHLISLFSILGMFLVLINLLWIALVLSIVCARYRDLPQMIISVLQVVFYITPIMWMPTLLPKRIGLQILNYNPLYHLIEIVRAPLLGELPTMTNWVASILFAVVGWFVALVIYGRYKRRIAYWL
ncbi:ABC transporter permease [Sodalis sp. RH15]|uniref:ABC transporter permease n=1 Tax=Sodalis sp. RH15 TaxID=3394330 RepID=UPI0039B44E4E